MALTYQEDLTQALVDNFNQDIVCHFPDGYYQGVGDISNPYLNMSTFNQVPDQPVDEYFMTFMITEGFTFNSSISNGDLKQKRLVVFVDIDIYWPVDKTKKRLQQEIEPALDSIYMNLELRGADDSQIYSQQEAPKDIIMMKRASGDNKWNEKSIRYPFVVRYV